MWFKQLIEPLGRDRNEILICNVLRCRPPYNKYPTGTLRKAAEQSCRQYDDRHQWRGDRVGHAGGLRGFAPDLCIVTEHPASILHSRQVAKVKLIRKHMERAFQWADAGKRPLVLMGRTAAELVNPELMREGGLRRWFGHWWEVER